MSVSDPDSSEARPSSKTILLVEEDNRRRASLSATMRSMGYKVYSTSNGLEALAAAEGIMASIGLVIANLVMPGMNAEKLWEALKERDYRGMMLVVTSDPMSEMGVTLAERPGVVPMQKGIGNEELRRLLAQTVGKQGGSSVSEKK